MTSRRSSTQRNDITRTIGDYRTTRRTSNRTSRRISSHTSAAYLAPELRQSWEDFDEINADIEDDLELSQDKIRTGAGWQVINSLFAYLDHDNEGTLDRSELLTVLKLMGDEDLTEVIENVMGSCEVVDKEQLHSLLFAPREHTCTHRFGLFILMWVLPLFYSATTRLPFISLALEVTVARNGTLLQASIILGSYQTCRALANAIISVFGGTNPIARLHVPMILSGLLGWLYTGLIAESDSVWSLLGLCFVGLAEVVVNLQVALIQETRCESPAHIADPEILSGRLRSQYASVSFGSFVTYVVGGYLYTAMGFKAVCALGMICQIIQLVGTAVYLCAVRRQRNELWRTDADLDGQSLLKSIIYRLKAMLVLVEETQDVSQNNILEKPGIADAIKLVGKDAEIIDSLKRLYHAFYVDKGGAGQDKNIRRDSNADCLPMKNLLTNADVIMNISKNHNSHQSPLAEVYFAKVTTRLMDVDGDGQVSEKEFVQYLAPRVYLSLYGSLQIGRVNVIWPYLKFVVLTQAVMALCIGTFLSTAVLMYTETFQITTSVAGLLLGIGEGLGALVIFCSGFMNDRMRSKCLDENEIEKPSLLVTLSTRPLHLPVVLIAVGVATMGFSAPTFALAIICQMVMSSLNDLSVTLLNELIATSIPTEKFKQYQGLGQWLRRLGNMITAFSGPVLFGLNPGMPFLLFGGIIVVWSLLLWFLFYRHAMQILSTEQSQAKRFSKKRRYSTNDKQNRKSFLTAPIHAFNKCVHTPWHMLEREYYASNREEVDEKLAPGNIVFDVEAMESRIRRIGAALRAEAAKRESLESELIMEVTQRQTLEEQVALIMKEKVLDSPLLLSPLP